MFIRSRVRYNCFSMKKGNPPKDQNVVDEVASQFTDGQGWHNFTEAWDVVVKPDSIKVIPNITDIARVSEVCMAASLYTKKGLSFDFDTDEERAILAMIESHFLEGKMSWSNFRSGWNIRWDSERNRIETYLTNLPSTQAGVTPEMIEAQLARGIAESTTQMLEKPMSATALQEAFVKGK